MNQTIGILGGGQLGKMLYLAGANLAMSIKIMDSVKAGPAGLICSDFTMGDFTDYDDIVTFGQKCDIVTIEIEKINVDALKELQGQGKLVYPQPQVIELIQDKGLQKDFYKHHALKSSDYTKYDTLDQLKADLKTGKVSYPFVQKIRVGGYDGRGVQIIRSDDDLSSAFESYFIIEDVVSIEKEISVVTCRSIDGEIICYDPVEMVFDPVNNILDYQLGPALISDDLVSEAKALAFKIAEELQIVGLLAIEMFVTKDQEVYINECAPRPHNSGHHTIEACYTSQYENHLRAISGLSLGSPDLREKSVLINLLGEDGHSGPVCYQGLNEVLAVKGVNVHLYGKTTTKPHRKMGHITIVDNDSNSLMEKYKYVHKTIKVISTNE